MALTEVWANSGYWQDIQNAINQVAGVGNVHIPAGTFNFVDVSETWNNGPKIIVPAGVNVFGAPTPRDANNQVIDWKTILVVPYDVPSGDLVGWKSFFGMRGSKPSRFSDIKLIGYRNINPSSVYTMASLGITGIIDFRIDHCYFLDVTGGMGTSAATDNGPVRGVIDHNRLVNTVGNPGYGPTAYPSGTPEHSIDYGIMPYRTSKSTYWDPNIMNVLGKYTDYSVYIEDNYFSRWRHCVASINGMHYVFRHNMVQDDYGGGTLDGHGAYTYVGTRAMEVYDNQFLDPNYIYEVQPSIIQWRGGGGVFFNNTIRDYYFTIYLRLTEGLVPNDTFVQPTQTIQNPIYFWSNNYLHGGKHYDQPPLFLSGDTPGPYFYQNTAMPNYTPYPYPHPLTLEGLINPRRITGTVLEARTNTPLQGAIVEAKA